MNPTHPSFRSIRHALRAGLLAAAFGIVGSGCVVQDQRPMAPVFAQKATAEIPQDELLDVGIHVFDPNIPDDEKEQEQKRIFPDVRKAESRYMPIMLRDTLESTGHWGQVRVLPSDSASSDVNVDGRILESTGRELRLAIKATDATGRVWLQKEYKGDADVRAYKDVAVKPRDPFDNVYATIANDLLAARRELTREERVQVHQVAGLRFAADLAPYAFKPYLARDERKGSYAIERLPAQGDPVVERMERVRERDYALVDTLNEHYTSFSESMGDAYGNWRKYSHEELEAEAEARRKALTRQVLGAVAVVGGIVAGSEANSSAGSAASTAAVLGGIYAFKSGLDMRAEIKMHGESIKQLGSSFQNEVQPIVVDIEGRTLELKGSAEQQYAEWRQLLRELYENETGLPATASTEAAKPAPTRR
ncbi:MAG TPA: hypothetical protein VFI92_12920 [Steroidobacteraceae bacterium]|nr:hypothetical protein [Steroidobacteraceae bacterium]